MTKKERAAAVTELLKTVYPEAVCALHYTHDYELLFATRLSAQCTDARVNIVTEKLFKQFPTLQSFADASEEEIAEAIKTCGLFRTKARDLKACAMMLIANYGGRVPDTMEELLKLPGVGRKTANLILGGYFRQTGHCVRYALYPFIQPAGLRQEREGPGQGGERPEKAARPGGVVRFLPPAGAVRPRALHGAQPEVRGLSARRGVPVVSHCEIT